MATLHTRNTSSSRDASDGWRADEIYFEVVRAEEALKLVKEQDISQIEELVVDQPFVTAWSTAIEATISCIDASEVEGLGVHSLCFLGDGLPTAQNWIRERTGEGGVRGWGNQRGANDGGLEGI